MPRGLGHIPDATATDRTGERDSLIIEAQINVDDISEDMRAVVHLTAYKARITPVVRGKLAHVSADRLTDNRTGTSYYTALVQVDQNELADVPM
jgi:membrane fusion protein, type I secretion system